MTDILTFAADEVVPDRGTVFENQSIPAGKAIPESFAALCTTALELLARLAAPAGVLREISQADFEVVYHGEGRNEPRSPVGDIFAQADRLALFAVTLGEAIGGGIKECFESKDFAVGAMLDSAASAATDKLAEVAERRFREKHLRGGQAAAGAGVLRYSPGYCGWHVSGQKKLFEFLQPGRIGIALRDSYLMEPLKSVSGVIIAGRKEIHDFPSTYPFCSRCAARECRERIRALLGE